MKTKNIFLTAALVAASFTTYAQVGVGTTTPKGALQVTSTTSGVIIPQFADLTAIQAIKKADGTTALDTEEQGMQVYNIAEKKNYLWDGTAWVARSAGKWVDDVNGDVVLDMTASVDSLKIKSNTGGLYQFSKNYVSEIYDSSTGTYNPTMTFIEYDGFHNNISLMSSQMNAANNVKRAQQISLNADDGDSSTKLRALNVTASTLHSNSNDLQELSSVIAFAVHDGSGNINDLSGINQYNIVRNSAATVNRHFGGKFYADFFGGTVNTQYGVEGISKINASSSLTGYSIGGNFLSTTFSTGTGGTMIGVNTALKSDITAGNVTAAYLFKGTENFNSATIVSDIYGLYLNNIDSGTNSSYAIYTNSGKVRFGDDVATTKTIKVGTTTATATAGMIKYETGHFYGYNGTAWVQLDN